MPERYNAAFWQYVDQLVSGSAIIIDRARGSAHPNHSDHVYPMDYGYLAGTSSSDGAGIDVWVGSGAGPRVTGIVCTVDLLKRDAEIKVLFGCNENEMRSVVAFHNNADASYCYLVRRDDHMM